MEIDGSESLPNDIEATDILKGEQEANDFPENLRDRGVPDFGYSTLNRRGLLYEPVLDKGRHQIQKSKPTWPNDKEFAVCLTHDVDHVTAHSLKQAYRRFTQKMSSHRRARSLDGDSFAGGSVMDVAKSVALEARYTANALRNSGDDPFHCFERWLEAEQSVGAKSTFFFLPTPSSPAHVSDPEYRFSDEVTFDGRRCTVGEMMREIDSRGWEIGLHPTWYALDDAEKLRREKSELEAVIGKEVESVRHHYLHYDIRKTPRVQDEAGFKYDSTLGFNRNVGFRFGTSYPWRLYDLDREEETDVLEIPLVVQDTALFRSKGLDVGEDIAFEYIKEMVERVKSVNGTLTLLWHPSKIVRDEWWSLYERTLKHLDEQGAWFATISELGSWWKKNGPSTTV